ncbi:MAG TPA: trypsin-like peptidase domain-containing protein [Ktedonobacteraceae bacterium]
MLQTNERHPITQPGPSFFPGTPYRRGMRTGAIVALSVLLIVVFGTGLFSSWVFATRNSGGSQAGSTPATISGQALDALRETVVEQVRPTVVQLNVATATTEGLGSGVILDSQGYIVTNAHVISGAQRIQVTLYDGTSLLAQLVGSDPLDDLAVVKISTHTKLVAAITGDSSKLRVGQEVLAIGNPLGITQTVTSGIISALGRAISSIPDAIQTDAAINPGNSGGALVDLQGKLVGIPTLTAIDPQFRAPANGVGFAIPSNRVNWIAPQLIRNGKVTNTGRAAMGVQLMNVDAVRAVEHNLAVASGALVVGITAGGPAEAGGLKPGDVIIQIGTHPVAVVTDFAAALLALRPGEVVSVTLYRGSERLTIKVTLGEVRTP